ncbi:hypothetical protein GCM10027160_10410 [Streptomyces calidiresistens]
MNFLRRGGTTPSVIPVPGHGGGSGRGWHTDGWYIGRFGTLAGTATVPQGRCPLRVVHGRNKGCPLRGFHTITSRYPDREADVEPEHRGCPGLPRLGVRDVAGWATPGATGHGSGAFMDSDGWNHEATNSYSQWKGESNG